LGAKIDRHFQAHVEISNGADADCRRPAREARRTKRPDRQQLRRAAKTRWYSASIGANDGGAAGTVADEAIGRIDVDAAVITEQFDAASELAGA
jgi:hypothetical protein